MPQAKEIAQRTKDAWLFGIVPGNAEQAFTIVIWLGHPNVRDQTGSTDIRQDTRLARVNCPEICVPSVGIPRGEAAGHPVLDSSEFIQHGIFLSFHSLEELVDRLCSYTTI